MNHSQRFTIPRRDLLAGAIGASACAMTFPAFGDSRPEGHLHLLSKQGGGRATGYAEANRIKTSDVKTHVAWLDSPAEGFRVWIATLDHTSGQWSPTYTVGEAKDNHGGPALTIDSDGHLHTTPTHRTGCRQSNAPRATTRLDRILVSCSQQAPPGKETPIC